MPHRHRQRKKYPEFRSRQGELVVVAGELVEYAAETSRDPINIDHFWITIRTGHPGVLRIALSTFSRINARAGFDPRVRVGIVASRWTELPAAGVFESRGLDYAEIESKNVVHYAEYERPALEELLLRKIGRSVFVEPGEHQLLHTWATLLLNVATHLLKLLRSKVQVPLLQRRKYLGVYPYQVGLDIASC